MLGRLNIFQKCMLQWNELHPYSAIHVAQIRGALDTGRLRTCVLGTLRRHGLGRLHLDAGKSTFQYEDGPADCEFRTISGSGDVRGALAAEMERQLNLPFTLSQPFSPFRFLIAPGEGSFFLGLVYFHPVADAGSVVCLLRDIVSAYVDGPAVAGADSLDLYPGSRAHLLRHHPVVVVRKLLALPAQMRRLRQSHRPRQSQAGTMNNGFVASRVPPDHLRTLVAAAKCWDVSVNDLFLAALMKSLSPCAAGRVKARKRRKLSIGCIVDVRQDLGVDSRRTFGLFLGSFTITHEVPDGISLRDLAQDIRRTTLRIKRHKSYLGTALELGLARLLFGFFSPEGRKRFYAKHYPLWGGITNMNLNRLWNSSGNSALLDYFRGVSTGPVTPLALSVTTVGDRANLGLSYRTAVFSRIEVEGLLGRFLEELKETRACA